MHTAIFKLFPFPLVVNPEGQSTAQSFFTRIIAPYTLDTYQIHTKPCTSVAWPDQLRASHLSTSTSSSYRRRL